VHTRQFAAYSEIAYADCGKRLANQQSSVYTGVMQSESERDMLAVLWSEQAKLNMTDYKFSRYVGLPQSTISRLKSGKRGVSTDLMFKFSALFPSVRMFLAARLLSGTEEYSSSKREHVA
jgi:hypothetical protein